MPLRAKQVTFFAAKLLLSIGVLVYLVRRLDLDQLRSNLFAVDPWTFLLALALVGLQTAILNGRWMLIMRSLGVSIEWLAGMRILLISLWFNQVLPSSAGGDVVRDLAAAPPRRAMVAGGQGRDGRPLYRAARSRRADGRGTAFPGHARAQFRGGTGDRRACRCGRRRHDIPADARSLAGAHHRARSDLQFRPVRRPDQVPAAAVPAARTSVRIRDLHPSDDDGILLRAGDRLAGQSFGARRVDFFPAGHPADRGSDLDQRLGSPGGRHGGLSGAGRRKPRRRRLPSRC